MNSCLLSWWPCENALQDVWCRILKMQNEEKEKLFFSFPLQEGRLLEEKKIHNLLTNHPNFEFQGGDGLAIHWVEYNRRLYFSLSKKIFKGSQFCNAMIVLFKFYYKNYK